MKTPFGWLIGDPHLGRKFEVGVPLHRRGEREREQLQQFNQELAQPGEMVVMVGDLFDHPYVPHTIVKAAIDAVLSAAEARPKTRFVMMAGNHDMPRKITGTGAFDVFKRAVDRRLLNVRVLTEPEVINEVAFFPWEWDRSALDQMPKRMKVHGIKAAVGHWDLASYGGDDSHLAPVAALRDAFGPIPLYSGHYHVPGEYNGVACTGSMQPYTQAEDPEGLTYVTVDLDQLESLDTRQLCVRVRLKPGEVLPDGIDARSIVGQRVAGPSDPESGQSITLDKFDWNGIVHSALKPLDPEVRAFIEERLPAHGSKEQ